MTAPVPGPGALVSYIRTGSREARIAYRELEEKERLSYRTTVARVFEAALAHHCGLYPSRERMYELIERLGERHPQYAGGTRRVILSALEGTSSGGMSVRQVITAQHLVIREVAKLHRDFLEAAETLVDPGQEFTGTDPQHAVSITLRLDGALHALQLHRAAERMGVKALPAALIRAWVEAEKQRWRRAKELGRHDDFPEIGSGKGGGDDHRHEAYSTGSLCRATVDRYGRVRAFTFMRTALFDDGRLALAAQMREAIKAAQAGLKATL